MTQVNTSMNFLPEDYVEKRQAARTAIVFIGLLLVVVGGIVGAYLYSQWSMSGVFKARDDSKSAVDAQWSKIKEADELDNQKGTLIVKMDVIAALMEHVRRTTLLKELSTRAPKGVGFVSMDLKSKEIEANKPNPAIDQARHAQDGTAASVQTPALDVTVTLMATAPTDADVATYLSNLQKSAYLSSVTLLFSEEFRPTKDDPLVRRFSFEMHLNPDANDRVTVANVLPE